MPQTIAISILDMSGWEAPLDTRFGRAFAFLITDGEQWQVVPNSGRDAAHGAGTSGASAMSDYGVDVVISGRFGPKAQSALEAMGIEMWVASNQKSARDVFGAFREGQLTRWA
jgi:predicted Fe-Mo cluster-binding NifX family protein